MSCKYAFEAGRMATIERLRKRTNELFEQATTKKFIEEKHSNEYWRAIGKQDILLQILTDLGDMIGEKYE